MPGRRLWIIALLLLLMACAGTREHTPTPAEATRTAVGEPAPALRVTTLDGAAFALAEQRGKVVFLNFWATWCPPCRQELPHLRDTVWRRHADRSDFVLISIAREESAATVADFLAEHAYGWTFATDPERKNYARFADAHIPRSYVIDREGRIVAQVVGFEATEFDRLVAVLDRTLAAGR